MLGDARPVIFIATCDFGKAREFYADTLGLGLLEETQFALVFAAGPITLRVTLVESFTPQIFTIAGWEVDDIVQRADDLLSRHVPGLIYPWFEQDDRGIWTTPNGSRILWFEDTDKNVLSLSQIAS